MLKNGHLYKDQIEQEHYRVWYDDRYKFYFGSYRNTPWFGNENQGDKDMRVFASVDPKYRDVIGMITYHVDRISNGCAQFGIINYYIDDARKQFIFGRDLAQAIDDIFVKFNHHRLEWWVIQGNPIEKSYDKFTKMLGGRVIGVLTDCEKIDDRYYSSKLYEIMQDDYMKNRHKIMRGKRDGKQND